MYKAVLDLAETLLETCADTTTLKKYREAKAGLLLNGNNSNGTGSHNTSFESQNASANELGTSMLNESLSSSRYPAPDASAFRNMRNVERKHALENKILELEQDKAVLERRVSAANDAIHERDALIAALQSSVESCEAGVRRAEELLSHNQQAFHKARTQLESQVQGLQSRCQELQQQYDEAQDRVAMLNQVIEDLKGQLAGALDWKESHEAKVVAQVRATIERDLGADLRAMQQAVANDIAAIRANAAVEIRKANDRYRSLVYRMITLRPLLEALADGNYTVDKAPSILSALNLQMQKLDAETLGQEAERFFDALSRLTAAATKSEGLFVPVDSKPRPIEGLRATRSYDLGNILRRALRVEGHLPDREGAAHVNSLPQSVVCDLLALKESWVRELHEDAAIAEEVHRVLNED